ncbi:MAG: helix-turn-helix domain-containing protein [Clostridia bacterium]|nr:helix-turn-helix domain-containing protein [Clostridia bacterium]
MLYQKLLLGDKPYFISVGSVSAFEVHRHPEIELNYCLNGSCQIIVDNKSYLLNQGTLMLINPMTSHEILEPKDPSCVKITIELGPSLLGDYFEHFMNLDSNLIMLDLKNDPSDKCEQLKKLLEEIALYHTEHLEFYDLILKGNLYKLGAILLQEICSENPLNVSTHKKHDIIKIEQALSCIYNRYFEPLNIEQISAECGYSKSNFCKIFKSITGDTFHNILNKHRIEIACVLLKNSTASIEEIALNVGFADVKSFCRVFKKLIGQSAGNYRKT